MGTGSLSGLQLPGSGVEHTLPSRDEVKERVHAGCPGGNVPDLGRMFLTLKYTDITQNTSVYPKLNGYGDNGERILKV